MTQLSQAQIQAMILPVAKQYRNVSRGYHPVRPDEELACDTPEADQLEAELRLRLFRLLDMDDGLEPDQQEAERLRGIINLPPGRRLMPWVELRRGIKTKPGFEIAAHVLACVLRANREVWDLEEVTDVLAELIPDQREFWLRVGATYKEHFNLAVTTMFSPEKGNE